MALHYFCKHDKHSYGSLTFRMNAVGFEALMLGAAIGQQLFSCLATTMPDSPSCVYLFQKGKNSHFDLRWPPRLKSVGLPLLFWCFKVEMYSNLTCALKRKKINSVINLNFMWLLCFFFFNHTPRECFQSGSTRQLGGKMNRLLKSYFFTVTPNVDFEAEDVGSVSSLICSTLLDNDHDVLFMI